MKPLGSGPKWLHRDQYCPKGPVEVFEMVEFWFAYNSRGLPVVDTTGRCVVVLNVHTWVVPTIGRPRASAGGQKEVYFAVLVQKYSFAFLVQK